MCGKKNSKYKKIVYEIKPEAERFFSPLSEIAKMVSRFREIHIPFYGQLGKLIKATQIPEPLFRGSIYPARVQMYEPVFIKRPTYMEIGRIREGLETQFKLNAAIREQIKSAQGSLVTVSEKLAADLNVLRDRLKIPPISINPTAKINQGLAGLTKSITLNNGASELWVNAFGKFRIQAEPIGLENTFLSTLRAISEQNKYVTDLYENTLKRVPASYQSYKAFTGLSDFLNSAVKNGILPGSLYNYETSAVLNGLVKEVKPLTAGRTPPSRLKLEVGKEEALSESSNIGNLMEILIEPLSKDGLVLRRRGWRELGTAESPDSLFVAANCHAEFLRKTLAAIVKDDDIKGSLVFEEMKDDSHPVVTRAMRVRYIMEHYVISKAVHLGKQWSIYSDVFESIHRFRHDLPPLKLKESLRALFVQGETVIYSLLVNFKDEARRKFGLPEV